MRGPAICRGLLAVTMAIPSGYVIPHSGLIPFSRP